MWFLRSIDWKWMLARGILGIAFGVFIFLFPLVTLVALALGFGAYLTADGIFALLSSFRHRRENRHWWTIALTGLLGIAAGLIGIIFPPALIVTMVALCSAWALLAGALQIYAAFTNRESTPTAVLLGMAGVISVVFGGAILLWPQIGVLALTTLIAAYSISYGIALTAWSFRLRDHQKKMDSFADKKSQAA